MDSQNIAFRESNFVKRDVEETERASARVNFIRFMLNWTSIFIGEAIGVFELSISKPAGFVSEIKSIIEFAVSKNVKNLILDFSNPEEEEAAPNVVELPESVYNLPCLESLKLFACRFDPTRFTNLGSVKTLSFGFTRLGKITSLLSNTPLVESLTIQNSSNVDLTAITGINNRLTELVIENSIFSIDYTSFDLPNIQIFKYVGEFHYFDFDRVNRIMQEVYLDFGAATEYDDITGTHLSGFLYNLLSARKLTVCPFLTQLIQESDDPVKLQAPMETTHLVIKTTLNPSEFIGIRLMINSCPVLETLTFEIIPPRPVISDSDSRFDPDQYWAARISHACLKKSLKFIEVKGFRGGFREAQVMQYLIGYSRVLEKIDLHLNGELEDVQKILARATGEMVGTKFYKGSKRVKVFVHDGEETSEF